MSGNDSRKLKMLCLLRIFEEKTDENHRLTMTELIAELEKEEIRAERKSIYSDIEALRDLGYDIIGERGEDGYRYFMGMRRFELAELKLLTDAVQSARFITEKKSDELIRKLETLCSVYDAKKLQRQVFVAGRIKSMNEGVFSNVDLLHEAIALNRKITFRYWNWNVKKEMELRHGGALYKVSPWGLSWDSENYYMIAFDDAEKKIKHYRVDKMQGITVTDEKREGRDAYKGIDIADYTKKTFGMFGGEERTVTMQCEDRFAGVMIDRFGKDVFLVPGKDGTFKITVRVAVSGQFTGWVIGLGTGVRVTGPPDVAEMIRKEALRIVEEYSGKG